MKNFHSALLALALPYFASTAAAQLSAHAGSSLALRGGSLDPGGSRPRKRVECR